ncbi:MAG: TetR/AcrR family transcriptional regulator [Chloroflexota bacterium]
MATTSEKSSTKREKVLRAALDVFSREGYGNTAVDDIAKEAATSKGGIYFHFPSKQALFLALIDEAGGLLLRHVEEAIERESDPLAKGDAALRSALSTFGKNRTLARLLLVEALGAGKEFNAKLAAMHAAFAQLITGYLDEAVAAGALPPHDTVLAGVAWFGAVNQVVTRWIMTGEPKQLMEAYEPLRALLLFGVSGEEGRR